jgi:hypothetical protein
LKLLLFGMLLFGIWLTAVAPPTWIPSQIDVLATGNPAGIVAYAGLVPIAVCAVAFFVLRGFLGNRAGDRRSGARDHPDV